MHVSNPDYPGPIEDLLKSFSGRYDAIPLFQSTDPVPWVGRPDFSRAVLTFRTQDNSRIVTVSPGQLAIKTGVPYEGWDEFHRRADESVRVFSSAYQNALLKSISLGFENLILVPADEEAEAYVPALHCMEPPHKMQLAQGYLSTSYTDPADGGTLGVSILRYPKRVETQSTAISLDLVSSSKQLVDDVPLEAYASLIDTVHGRLQYQFEAMITERARRQFGLRDV